MTMFDYTMILYASSAVWVGVYGLPMRPSVPPCALESMRTRLNFLILGSDAWAFHVLAFKGTMNVTMIKGIR